MMILATNRGGTVVDRRDENSFDCLHWMAEQKAQGRLMYRVSMEEAETIPTGQRYRPEKAKTSRER